MSWRLVVLHARARHLPAVAVGLALTTTSTWMLGRHLAQTDGGADPEQRAVSVVLGALIASALISAALAGADEELELSTRSRWWGLRAVLLATLVAGSAMVMSLAGWWEPGSFGAYAIVRDVLGLAGITAITAAAAGARASWIPGLVWTLVALFSGPDAHELPTALATWMAQPSSVVASWACALTLAAAGVLSHARWGARPLRGE